MKTIITKYMIPLLCLLLSAAACGGPKGGAGGGDLKSQALDFSLDYVETYFNGDCDKAYNMMSDSIVTLDGDGTLAKADFKDKICQSLGRAVRDKGKSFDDYRKQYDSRILSKAELEAEFNATLPSSITFTDKDFFFIGHRPKEGATASGFIWDDMFIFMVRKQGKVWRLKGVSG